MKRLLFANQEFEAQKIVKTSNSIIGYIDNVVVFKFNGISDFNGFTLVGGQEFDVPEPSDTERIEQLERENALLKVQKQALSEQVDFHEELIVELATQIYA